MLTGTPSRRGSLSWNRQRADPPRRVGVRIIIYIPALTILIAFIGEIKSAPALSKHRVRHRGICLLYRSLILNCKFPSGIYLYIFSIPIDIDTPIIISLSMIESILTLLTKYNQAVKSIKFSDERQVSWENKNVKMT